MLRKVLAFTAVVVFFVGAVAANAQDASTLTPTPAGEEFNFEKAYKDYVFVTDQYNKSHADYLLARAQYFQAQTLASQTKARDATALMLQDRDEVMKAYLVALRLRLSETEGISDITKSGLFARVDADVAWWISHKGRISSAGTLNDLVADSTEALKHFPTTEALSYEVLSNIPQGKVFALRSRLNELLSSVKTKISAIRAAGDHDVTNAERWVLETDQKITRSLDKENAAQALIVTLTSVDSKSRQRDKNETYNQVLTNLTDSLQYLREASNYMKEVIKSIKTKQ